MLETPSSSRDVNGGIRTSKKQQGRWRHKRQLEYQGSPAIVGMPIRAGTPAISGPPAIAGTPETLEAPQ